ncbi:sel1 repeat family protein [Frankia sp. CNm7]|uniref:tetratricopeptide repeat protein n=1 Tax=Frankia nepalensis TaxID=1836974 RepID=UPI001932729C|nr:tetratricopeptide repeat protein [Frankia nepalensis]MBL7523988.1 sel1 repeat family protein [Frankia nepalensis]
MEAAYNLGLLHFDADRRQEAEQWWRKAAEAEHAHAAIGLAHLLQVSGRAAEGAAWARRGAEAGGARDAEFVGEVDVHSGPEVRAADPRARDSEAARAAAKGQGRAPAAEAAWAQAVRIVENGRMNFDELEPLLRRAAQGDIVEAMTALGELLHHTGRRTEAVLWWRSADDAGDPRAAYNLGVIARAGNRVDEAERLFRRAAEAGHGQAMSDLGLLIKRHRDNPREAETWLRKGAELGDRNAANNLGALLLEAGRPEAEKWLRVAAEAGAVAAMSPLGVLLQQNGNEREAERWLRSGAEAGDALAAYNLGVLLRSTGRHRDANYWLAQARRAGLT